MNFTWDALQASQNALNRLRKEFALLGEPGEEGAWEFERSFEDAVNEDLNIPKALAIVWELLKSDIELSEKAKSILKFDEIFGLKLKETRNKFQDTKEDEVPEEILQIVREREELRKDRKYGMADQLRNKVKKMGYTILDDDASMTSRVKKSDEE